jgi:hypothetical protein
MKIKHHTDWLKKLAGLVGVAGVSVLISFPAGAQREHSIRILVF